MHDILDIVPIKDLARLDIRPVDIQQSEILRQKEDHVVCRLKLDRGWSILKWFEHDNAIEPCVYELLEQVGVPTLPLHACSTKALLLEDLEHSKHWRLATAADMSAEATGLAVAKWYQNLHRAGYQAFQQQANMPCMLRPWVEELSMESLTHAGARLGLTNKSTWQEAILSIEPLKVKIRCCPQTFNYEDFAQENLALSRDTGMPLQAIVFDYDWFTVGTAYSDWRNVTSSLQGDACQAFSIAYGDISQTERLLDLPLSTFYGLQVAAQREKVPDWARPLLASVEDGSLILSVHAAVQD
jgi:hypothetical protein